MSLINVALSDLPDRDNATSGQYRLRIESVSDPQPNKNMVQFVMIQFVISEGSDTGKKPKQVYVPLSGKSTFKKICRAAGFTEKDKIADTNDLVGKELDAILKEVRDDEFG
ncbi:MAG: hypothetical protein IH948_07695, partial [Bacteroidetes bacterium]|nr:hypothetical protein [Bacteroidota bacterium]